MLPNPFVLSVFPSPLTTCRFAPVTYRSLPSRLTWTSRSSSLATRSSNVSTSWALATYGRYAVDGSYLGDLTVPAPFDPTTTHGVRQNLAFEAAAVARDGRLVAAPAGKLVVKTSKGREEETLPAGPVKLNVLIYRSSDVEKAVNRIRGMGGEILDRMPAYFSEMATVRLPGSRVPDLARLPEVYVVEVAPEPKLEDECATQILAGRVELAVSPNLAWSNLVQYDSDSRELGFQSRLRWRVRPGSDVFVVFNRGWLNEEGVYRPYFDRGSAKVQHTFRW